MSGQKFSEEDNQEASLGIKKLQLLKTEFFRLEWAGLKAGARQHHHGSRLLAIADTTATELIDGRRILLDHFNPLQ